MRFLHLVRLLTLLITVVGCFVSTPVVWIAWLEQRLGLSGGIYESGYSYLTAALEIGVYITAASALILAFVAIPRRRWSPSALSWCFVVMGACLLAKLEACYSERFIFSIVMQIDCYAGQLWFALPPLLFGALLGCSSVRGRLYSSPQADATDV